MKRATQFVKKHGAAVVAFAGAVGAFVGQLGIESPAVTEALTGGGILVGFAGSILHAYIQGAAGKGS